MNSQKIQGPGTARSLESCLDGKYMLCSGICNWEDAILSNPYKCERDMRLFNDFGGFERSLIPTWHSASIPYITW